MSGIQLFRRSSGTASELSDCAATLARVWGEDLKPAQDKDQEAT
jgi:hypothetical protein